jgi:plasmid stabilization system protein ParE
MARRIVVDPQSDLDIQAAAMWYEDQQPGVGTQFLDELDLVLQRIAENPLQFPRLELEARRALMHRFPYGVYFLAEAEIRVLAVLHLHRQPDMWKSRQ